jgi:hypothetical protein
MAKGNRAGPVFVRPAAVPAHDRELLSVRGPRFALRYAWTGSGYTVHVVDGDRERALDVPGNWVMC